MNHEEALAFINKIIEFCGRGGAVVEMDDKNFHVTPYLVRKELLISQARETWLEEGALGPRHAREADARNSALTARLKDANKNMLAQVADMLWGIPVPALEELCSILVPPSVHAMQTVNVRRERLTAWVTIQFERARRDRESQSLPPKGLSSALCERCGHAIHEASHCGRCASDGQYRCPVDVTVRP